MKKQINVKSEIPEYVIAPLGFAKSIIESAQPDLKFYNSLPERPDKQNEKVAVILHSGKKQK